MGERWRIDAIVLPHGEQRESWWIEDGALHAGCPPTRDDVQPLPGRFVLPGLVDAHTHLTLDFANGAGTVYDDVGRALDRHLAAGVLAVRDVGAIPGADVGRGRGRRDRPDVLGGSRYLAPPGTYFPALYEGVEPAGAAKAAAAWVEAGVDWVKVVADSPVTDTSFFAPPATFTPDVLVAIVDAVHEAGGRVAAHVTGTTVSDVVGAGVDSVEHGSLVDRALLDDMASRGTAWTPTAGTVLAAVAQLEAAGVEPLLALARPHLERLEEMVPLAARLGVTILAGTDMLGHGNLASEVAALQRLGLPAEDALDAASGAARAYFDLPAFGEGQTAEIVTYDDDPRDEPAVLTRPVAVVHAGRRVR